MKFNQRDTDESFIKPISEEYFDYFKEREIVSDEYFRALRNGEYGILEENMLLINNTPFCLNCLLGESKESIFDIRGTNSLYGVSKDEGTAIAVLYGDDYIFLKPNDPKIYYKSISTDEELLIADTYNGFIKKLSFQEVDE